MEKSNIFKLPYTVPALPFVLQEYHDFSLPLLHLLSTMHFAPDTRVILTYHKGLGMVFQHRDAEYVIEMAEIDAAVEDGLLIPEAPGEAFNSWKNMPVTLGVDAISIAKDYVGYTTAIDLRPYDLYVLRILSVAMSRPDTLGATLNDLLNFLGGVDPYEITSTLKNLLSRRLIYFHRMHKPPTRLPYRTPIRIDMNNKRIPGLLNHVETEIVRRFQNRTDTWSEKFIRDGLNLVQINNPHLNGPRT